MELRTLRSSVFKYSYLVGFFLLPLPLIESTYPLSFWKKKNIFLNLYQLVTANLRQEVYSPSSKPLFCKSRWKNPQIVCHEFLLYGYPFSFFKVKRKFVKLSLPYSTTTMQVHSSCIKVYALLKRRRHIGKSFSLAAGT